DCPLQQRHLLRPRRHDVHAPPPRGFLLPGPLRLVSHHSHRTPQRQGRCDRELAEEPPAPHAYPHFIPSSSRPARRRSSGVITTLNWQSASKVRKNGSARLGIRLGSSRSTTRIPPRCPSMSVK